MTDSRRGVQGKKGFTMIELLTAVMVLIVLLGVAIPTYQNVIFRHAEARAEATLSMIVNAQNHYRLDHGSYAMALSQLDTYIDLTNWDTTDRYWFFTSSLGANSYTVVANNTVPNGASTGKTITVDQTGSFTRNY